MRRGLDINALSELAMPSDAIVRAVADVEKFYRQLDRTLDIASSALPLDRMAATLAATGTVFQELNRQSAAASLATDEALRPLATLERLFRDIERASAGIGQVFTGVTRSFDALSADLNRIAETTSRLTAIFDDARLTTLVDDVQATYTTLAHSTLLGRIEPVLWSDLLERRLASDVEVVDADAGESQRVTARAVVRAAFEGATSLDFEWLKTPANRVRFVVASLVLLCSLLTYLKMQRRLAADGRDAVERQRIERQQAEAIAALTETVRQLQLAETARTSQRATDRILRVRKAAVLREGPSSATRRLLTLEAGRRVAVLSAHGRWRYVEALAADDRQTGFRGWLYQRNLRAD